MARRADGTILLGPWGGRGGITWSFVKALAITKIKICVEEVIKSITFQYMDGQTARRSCRFGGAGGTSTEINLGRTEFIISMEGCYGAHKEMTIIYSLTFVTTVRKYGPYGRELGTQFSVPKDGGWIHGFFGRSGTLLDAIGVYKKTSFECGVLKVGPWGELQPRDLRDIEGTPTQLTKIIIRHSGCIESIKFQYVADGMLRWSSTWGGASGSTAEIDLETDHYLTAISGYYGPFHGDQGNDRAYTVIRSLKFVSTKGTHGPYGPEEGTPFSLPMTDGRVVGFFGLSHEQLHALGFYLKPNPCGVVKVGPWGGLTHGSLKDTKGTPTQLTNIIIRFSERLQSIKFQYVADGVAKWSSTWGSESGDTVEIHLTNHYLIDISGYYGDHHGSTIIKSLTFVSTRGTHGPYGRENGTAFSLPVKAGKIVGFFGRSRRWLGALGFYLMPN